MRGSGLSPGRTAATLAKIGAAFVVLTFAIGEWVAPAAEEAAQQVRLRALRGMIGQDLESGPWFKDGGAFINVREARDVSVLRGLRIYHFDSDNRLQMTSLVGFRAEKGSLLLEDTGLSQVCDFRLVGTKLTLRLPRGQVLEFQRIE